MSREKNNLILLKFSKVVETKFLVLRDHCVSKLPWIIDNLIKQNISNLDDCIIAFIRNLHCGDFSERTNKLLDLTFATLKSNLDWLMKQNLLIKVVFMKLIRLYSGYCYFNADNIQILNIKNCCYEIIVEIWKNKKEELFCLGKELIRILQDVFKRAVNYYLTNLYSLKGIAIFYRRFIC